jgi:hypothetical protein
MDDVQNSYEWASTYSYIVTESEKRKNIIVTVILD